MRRIRLFRLGRLEYSGALRWQDTAAQAVTETGVESLAILEHPPVYTVGYRARDDEFLVAPDILVVRKRKQSVLRRRQHCLSLQRE